MRTTARTSSPPRRSPWAGTYITLVNGGWGGFVTGLSSLNGMDASENETTRSYRFKNKTWYRFRVRVTDEAIRCWVDDKEIIAVEHREKHVGTRVETRSSEPLGFAAWKSGGALRNIEIRPLTARRDRRDQQARVTPPPGSPRGPAAHIISDRLGDATWSSLRAILSTWIASSTQNDELALDRAERGSRGLRPG